MVPEAPSRVGLHGSWTSKVGTHVLLLVVPDEILYDHRAMEAEASSGSEPPVVGVAGCITGY